MDSLGLLGIGAVLAGIVAWLWKTIGPRGPQAHDQGSARPLGPEESARHTSDSEAREQREAADDAAINEVDARPHTDDPVADLEHRLK